MARRSSAEGRYREFYQCDADVIGSDSLLMMDLINIIHDVFDALELGVKILLNNRKVLSGIAGGVGRAGADHRHHRRHR